MRTPRPLFLALLPLLLGSGGCEAVEPPSAKETIMEAYSRAIQSMEAANWQAAAATLKVAIDQFDGDAMASYGPAFGLLHYHLGLCNYQLKDYAAAAVDFETAYRDFSNREGAKTKNHYHHAALYQWGRSEQARGNPKAAVQLYKKYVSELPPDERQAAEAMIRQAESASEEK